MVRLQYYAHRTTPLHYTTLLHTSHPVISCNMLAYHHGESFFVCNINPPPKSQNGGRIFVSGATDLTNSLNER